MKESRKPGCTDILFRVDASDNIGIGHLVRCLALADVLVLHGCKSVFVMKEAAPRIQERILESDHQCVILGGTAAPCTKSEQRYQLDQRDDALRCTKVFRNYPEFVLVVDHYGIDESWYQALEHHPSIVLVIDDLANRKHHCDVLVDQTYLRDERNYSTLVPSGAMLLCGSQYALLRKEFAEARPRALAKRQRYDAPHNVLIYFGGTTQLPLIEWTLACLDKHFADRTLHIRLLGLEPGSLAQNHHTEAHRIECVGKAADMPEMLLWADLAIGAAGSASWERCATGLPTLMFVLAENQRLIGENLAQAGAVLLAGKHYSHDEAPSEAQERPFVEGFRQLFHLDAYNAMSGCASSICDGNGAKRVAEALLDRITFN